MKINSKTGIISLFIAIFIFIINLLLNQRLENRYDELGGVGELVTLLKYSSIEWWSLTILQLVGSRLGLQSGLKKYSLSGVFGFILGIYNLLELYHYR